MREEKLMQSVFQWSVMLLIDICAKRCHEWRSSAEAGSWRLLADSCNFTTHGMPVLSISILPSNSRSPSNSESPFSGFVFLEEILPKRMTHSDGW